jgi:hypothetical protein
LEWSSPDGREAGSQAALQALEQSSRSPVILGIIISSHNLPYQQVSTEQKPFRGYPLIGFTTSAELTSDGLYQRSVVTALITGTDATARSEFWPGYAEYSRGVSQKMAKFFQLHQTNGTLLLVADGFHGDPKDICDALPAGPYTLAGCLSGGELRQARTYQSGGRQSGFGGLAAALLSGNIATGVGIGNGWQNVGVISKSRVRGQCVRTLNNQPASEAYARWLGYQPREWSFPPLNELVRLYPLGIEKGENKDLLIRSPMRMESDGSLRMHTNLLEGETAHLLVGNSENCLRSAGEAASQALKSLGAARPVLGIVLPDISWQMLLETQPGAEIEAVRNEIGRNVPIIGGYTYGQISNHNRNAELYNQQIEVILIGEAA